MINIYTYGHRLKNNRHPVRSAKDKLQIDQLVVGWVTTSEYWLLYVFDLFFVFSLGRMTKIVEWIKQGTEYAASLSGFWDLHRKSAGLFKPGSGWTHRQACMLSSCI